MAESNRFVAIIQSSRHRITLTGLHGQVLGHIRSIINAPSTVVCSVCVWVWCTHLYSLLKVTVCEDVIVVNMNSAYILHTVNFLY